MEEYVVSYIFDGDSEFEEIIIADFFEERDGLLVFSNIVNGDCHDIAMFKDWSSVCIIPKDRKEEEVKEKEEEEEFYPLSYVFPYGKHSGEQLGKIPVNYLNWVVNNSRCLDNKLIRSIKHHLETNANGIL